MEGTSHSTSSEEISTTDINSDSELELPLLRQPSRTKTRLKSASVKTTPTPAVAATADAKLSCSSSTDINSDSDIEFVGVEESPSAKSSMSKVSNVASSIDDDNDEDCLVLHMDLSQVAEPGKCKSVEDTCKPLWDVNVHSCPVRKEQQNTWRRTTGIADDFDELPDIELPHSESARVQGEDAEPVDVPEYASSMSAAPVCATNLSVVSDHASELNDVTEYAGNLQDMPEDSGNLRKVPEYSNVFKNPQGRPYISGNLNDKESDQMKKRRKKRSPEEIAESKQLAEQRREQRRREQEAKKAAKEREMQLKKAAQQNKRHYRPGECVKFVTACVDPGVVNCEGLGAAIFKMCADAGIRCVTEQQSVPNTIFWKREILDCSGVLQETHQQPRKVDVVEDEVLAMIPLPEFISMVHAYIASQCGEGVGPGLTLREHIVSLQSALPGKTVTFFVLGLEPYLRGRALAGRQQHREAVLALSGLQGSSRAKQPRLHGTQQPVSSTQVEEALVDAQLHTDCIVQSLGSEEEVADLVRTFTKAVAEKPAKRDRLQSAFCFLEEGVAGVKVDKTGQGLLKVWKSQLLQFKSLGPDMAEAIVAAYPSPRLLVEAYNSCSTHREAERLLENIVVRRGAGVLATNRRIGKELSRRIHSFFTSVEPDFVLK